MALVFTFRQMQFIFIEVFFSSRIDVAGVCFVELERRNWVHFVVSVFGASRKRLKRVVHP